MLMLNLHEDDTYLFDADAADRPVRFIEKFLRHFTGRFAGQPFVLAPLQAKIVRDIFGWKSRATGFRRFTDVYWEGAVGAGKSPLLAALGLFGLIGDRERGAQVYNFASTNKQARLAVFDTARKFVKNSPELASRMHARHSVIRYPTFDSFWEIVPGTGVGAGANPSMVLADEAHDWRDSVAYDQLRERMTKRDQPLMIVATNAGKSQASMCWRLREKALAALTGTGDPALYPIIWAAKDDAKSDDPAAWKDANPLIGVTIRESKVAALCTEAVKDEKEEADFRRLYLGIWPKKQVDRWIDLSLWDIATSKLHVPPPDAALYTGFDLSQSDDLCAAVWVRVTPELIYVDSHFWMPKVTAERYDLRDSVGYVEWAKAGHVTLLDEPTVSNAAMRRIAAEIIERKGGVKIAAACYDRYKADVCVKTLEASGVPCVPIAQGTSLSPGCNELDKRLKEQSIIITPNPLMRWCAENVEVKRDDHDNLWPVKPNAKEKYAGRRGLKIDGLVALVTALVQARKHAFPVKKSNARVINL